MLIADPARSVREKTAIPPDVLVYASALKVAPVLDALERFGPAGPGPGPGPRNYVLALWVGLGPLPPRMIANSP
jgi:hypothetical protein